MSEPIVLATWKFGAVATGAAWPALEEGGRALDAVEAGCCAVEADPEVRTVGYGSYADRAGDVSLDGCVMLSPKQCGGVGYVRRYMHPVSIARLVMERTRHVLLAGAGAEAFAASQGMEPAELMNDAMREHWEKWRRENPEAASDPTVAWSPERNVERRDGAGQRSGEERQAHDTVGVLAIDERGELAGACSTSGLPYKLPGRVGDSPIIGHGLYVHPEHGAAVATGTGELMMRTCAAFLAVESMRRGDSPHEAGMGVLRRIAEDCGATADQQCGMILLRPDGEWSSVSLSPGYSTAVRSRSIDEQREPGAVLFA